MIRLSTCTGPRAPRLLAILLMLGASNAALAQGMPDEAEMEGGLREIVVTAQKHPENLQATPIAISVLDSTDLENRHIQSLLDLAGRTRKSIACHWGCLPVPNMGRDAAHRTRK